MIYLLEDDESIRKFVVYALNSQGLTAKGFGLPSEFYAAMRQQLPQLILLDLMLPEEDGLSILKKLRENPESRRLPVLLLTAKGSEYDKVIGLDSGADDYITKPFGTMELISRVRAHLRRAEEGAEPESYTRGEIRIIPEKHQVLAEGKEIALTLKEYELLYLLMRDPGKVFTRDQLLQRIWGYEYQSENRTVDVHIKTLRAKLGPCGEQIETVRGVGYRMSMKR